MYKKIILFMLLLSSLMPESVRLLQTQNAAHDLIIAGMFAEINMSPDSATGIALSNQIRTWLELMGPNHACLLVLGETIKHDDEFRGMFEKLCMNHEGYNPAELSQLTQFTVSVNVKLLEVGCPAIKIDETHVDIVNQVCKMLISKKNF